MKTNPTKTNKPDATPPVTESNNEGTTALNATTESNPMPEVAPETETTTKKRKANRDWLERKLDWIKQQKSILTELMGGKCCICHSTAPTGAAAHGTAEDLPVGFASSCTGWIFEPETSDCCAARATAAIATRE